MRYPRLEKNTALLLNIIEVRENKSALYAHSYLVKSGARHEDSVVETDAGRDKLNYFCCLS